MRTTTLLVAVASLYSFACARPDNTAAAVAATAQAAQDSIPTAAPADRAATTAVATTTTPATTAIASPPLAGSESQRKAAPSGTSTTPKTAATATTVKDTVSVAKTVATGDGVTTKTVGAAGDVTTKAVAPLSDVTTKTVVTGSDVTTKTEVKAPIVGSDAHPKAKSTAPDTSVITDKLIVDGRNVFRGHGGCVLCHGQNLEGIVGPTLKAHQWKDAENGDFAPIIRVVSSGVPGTVMVSHPNGVSDAQIIAVAAYIWGVNHGRTKP